MKSNNTLTNSVKRRILSGALIFVLALQTAFFGVPGQRDSVSQAATASYQKDEYKSDLAEYMEGTMNKELQAYFSGSNGKKVKMEKSDDPGYKTLITFYLDPAKIGGMDTDTLMGYLFEVIAANPNFCTLSTHLIWSGFTGEFKVYSVIAKSKQVEAITEYKSFLADIERVPLLADDMSDIEILLHLHDMLVQQATYTDDPNDNRVYVSHTMSKTGKVVCQSYATVLSNLMRDLGFTCYALTSDSHEWNMVKLDGKWTCIDVTWDDSSVYDKNTVRHENFLVKLSSFKSSHKIEDRLTVRFNNIKKKLENQFTTLPKSDRLLTPVCYKGGIWFYADGGNLYRWDGVSKKADIEDEVPEDYMRCVGVIDETVYIGGTDGLFVYDPESHVMTPVKTNVEVSGLYYFGKTLYYKANGKWKKCAVASSPYTYEMLNGTINQIILPLKVPTKPVIKIMKSSAKSIRVTVTKKAESANGGYQIQYSTDPNFSYNNKKKTVKGLSASLTGLTKGVKYYVRARGIYKQDEYMMKYGKWSKTKKV